MRKYADGDTTAFDVLYERYRGPLYRYVLRQVSDPATANDLYQGSWEKLIRARARFPHNAPFRAWLFRIARNHVVDHFRAERPQSELSDQVLANPGAAPDETASEQEDRARLLQAIRDLPVAQRDAILLRLEGGFGVEEIGRITGAGFETAKSRLRYATRKLKEVLDP